MALCPNGFAPGFVSRRDRAMGLLDRFKLTDDWERDRWWLRTDEVDEPPPDDYEEAAQQQHYDEAFELGVEIDPRAGYHRYDGSGERWERCGPDVPITG